MWLDWDGALAVLGHDHEVKDFYSKILNSSLRPDLFVDVGANYGIHTALFLSAGVRALSFEPNPDCVPYFTELAEANEFTDFCWQGIAIGETRNEAKLIFRPMDTWLGAISLSDSATSEQSGAHVVNVSVQALDDVPDIFGRCLTKIDVEGHEIFVMRGGRKFFREKSLFVVFESNDGSCRGALFDEFVSLGYSVERVPVPAVERSIPLSRDGFIGAAGTNFVARNLRRSELSPSLSR